VIKNETNDSNSKHVEVSNIEIEPDSIDQIQKASAPTSNFACSPLDIHTIVVDTRKVLSPNTGGQSN